ncbi:SH3 beta-barrel fold-containing protein [Ornithobacterium rhinotracheale]|uniref:SH3 beta-barrel fold-containing protein n=1 Tax=Ornithobacterium rhinotracheale TaxID=28251 RepID=UPI001FF43D70|nr:SH3 beta-barrel fold-containing protein [Ornithobacterium rhinotracheale]MCK0201351.1 SH3 beta-barrel fold-containing protein [Ornithobacterium rhinotracheale]
MKTQDLKNIMQTAWQFFKQTGIKFSECLKKAWANYKLKRAMQTKIVRFYFQKVNGEIREAWGTLSPKLMPETKGADRKPNPTTQVYFDTEKHEFRCFKKFNLIY